MAGEESIAVIGAGSWGTALAIQLARGGGQAALWGREEDGIHDIAADRVNQRFLPGAPLPDTLTVSWSLEEIISAHRDIMVAVPSEVFAEVLTRIREFIRPDARVSWATKGLDLASGELLHQLARRLLGETLPLAVLSGPTFAAEVGQGLPTALTVAATEPSFAEDLAHRLSSEGFRAYTSTDMIGVQVGGAVKNVLAIAAGISDGLGFGANARAALITRGLREMSVLGMALGARSETFMGLSGMGDLVLTCTDNQSRNRRMGLAVGQGKSIEATAESIGQVVEGVVTAGAVHQLAMRLGVEMPICEQVYGILHESASPQESVQKLLNRALTAESVD